MSVSVLLLMCAMPMSRESLARTGSPAADPSLIIGMADQSSRGGESDGSGSSLYVAGHSCGLRFWLSSPLISLQTLPITIQPVSITDQ